MNAAAISGATLDDQRPFTEVAVGLVFDTRRRVLMAQRPAGKPYAGWWEFPGGKIEPGETVQAALARELEEELGIQVATSHPWVLREHSYEHARVRLHFQRIFAFSGQPESREKQAFQWCHTNQIAVAPLLPAALPLVGWLALPDRVELSALRSTPGTVVLSAQALLTYQKSDQVQRLVAICACKDDLVSAQSAGADMVLLEKNASDLPHLLALTPAPAYIHDDDAGAMLRKRLTGPTIAELVQGVWSDTPAVRA